MSTNFLSTIASRAPTLDFWLQIREVRNSRFHLIHKTLMI
jgi:hypothetical protein